MGGLLERMVEVGVSWEFGRVRLFGTEWDLRGVILYVCYFFQGLAGMVSF